MGVFSKLFGPRCSRCGKESHLCGGHKVDPRTGVKPGTRDRKGRMRQPRVPVKDTKKKFGR